MKYKTPGSFLLLIFLFILGSMLPEVLSASVPGIPTPDKSAPQQNTHESTVRLGTDLVVLDVTVLDKANRTVGDLSRENFSITEDRVRQKVEFFSRDQVPVSVVFAIDTSGSMVSKLETVIKACNNLVREARPEDEIAIMQFKKMPELLEKFTPDTCNVMARIEKLAAGGKTAMLDALTLAADYANHESRNRRKAVFLLTDGLDRDSHRTLDDVIHHLRQTDVQIYLIGFIGDLGDGSGIFARSLRDKAQNLLSRLASGTGGKAFFPKQIGETEEIAQKIATDLHMQYSLGYYPTNLKRDGTFREVKVTIKAADRHLVARTREGYMAPRGTGSH